MANRHTRLLKHFQRYRSHSMAARSHKCVEVDNYRIKLNGVYFSQTVFVCYLG